MNSFQIRNIEYSAIRAYLKIIGNPHNSFESKLAAAIEDELTPRQAQLTQLYYLKQMPMIDIAKELNISVSTVSRTLKRARIKLEKILKYSSEALLNAYDDMD